MTDAAAMVLLAIGAFVLLGCSIGLVVMDDVFDRLHFVGPSLLAVWTITLAIVLKTGLSASGIKALLVAVFLTVAGPVLTHATARAARVRQYGRWIAQPGERHPHG